MAVVDPWHAWTRQLYDWWYFYRQEFTDAAMQMPQIRLVEGAAELGSWNREQREICIGFEHVRDDPWLEVMATLRHEMAHQYVDEVMLIRDEAPHGPAFRRACRIFRVEPCAKARGPDRVAGTADDAASRLTRVISKLLALGGSPNENEASAAVRKARQLMLEHNIDTVERDRERGFIVRAVGPIKRRHAAWEGALGTLLSEFFFVQVIWAKNYDPHTDTYGSALYVHGTPANLEMAEYVHTYLSRLLPDLWREHKRELGLTGDTGRMEFFDGVLHGFRQKLREQTRELANAERALVWQGDPRLDAHYRWHHPHIRSPAARTRWMTETYSAGRRAGRNVSIQRPIGGAAGGFGGQLSG